MGLHDRLSKQGDGGTVVALTPNGNRPTPPSVVSVDPYADLKARIHHQCIAKLGPELYKQDSDDLSDRVYRAVSEALALARPPLTRGAPRDRPPTDRRHPRLRPDR